ncbi:MAG: CCA tRNA nucleotidyltransferase [Candidatus Micrarchaeota archaeon]|nr:CCA tRNA nucleotidyltransferase [Candidatus Micrarchaeota archaeon]
MQKLIEKVKKKLRPSKKLEEKISNLIHLVKNNLQKTLPKDVEILLCGSVAKGTYLNTNIDIDFFLLFGPNYSTEQIKKLGLLYSKKAFQGFRTEVRYAQHPYLKVFYDNFKIDIVPSSKTANIAKLKTAVDRSQLHTQFINSHLKEEQKDEVRLLKKFLDNLGIYGASLRVEGFSGYLCELLILYYGSFLKLLEAAAKWEKYTVIDVKGYYSKEEALNFFKTANFIVVDPVDKKRNVAAVVSRTSFSRFVLAARKFLAKPSLLYFFPKKPQPNSVTLKKIIQKRKSNILVISFKNPDLVEDILWPQLRKMTNSLVFNLEKEEFRIIDYYFYADETNCFILLESLDFSLPLIKHIQGPEIFDEKNVQEFIKKHKKALNIHVEHHQIIAIEKRKFFRPEELVSFILKNPAKFGIPKELHKAIAKASIFKPEELLKNKTFLAIAADYFLRKIN